MAQTFGGLEFQAARRKHSKEYGAFVEKFKVKHTTDDCYTPPKVYEAVLKFCRERLGVPADASRCWAHMEELGAVGPRGLQGMEANEKLDKLMEATA